MSSEVTVNSQIGILWEARMLQMLHDPRLDGVEHRWCDATSNTLAADPSPQVHEFVRTIGLPLPELTVAPGYALAGMPAFLQIDGQDPIEVDESISGFGGLQVQLRAVVFVVDWGDGTVQVVDDGRTGAAWDGPVEEQISHTYVHADNGSQVAVEARWVAIWEVAGFSGVIDDLRVTASLDLPVEAKRSVRISPDTVP